MSADDISRRKSQNKLLLQGGFQQSMTRREAALILGIREHAKEDMVKDAHRKIMIANHPDAGQADPHFDSFWQFLQADLQLLSKALLTFRWLSRLRFSQCQILSSLSARCI